MVLNNLRVFLIFDWLELVRDFLQVHRDSDSIEPQQHFPSNTTSELDTIGAVMPKTVKSGVVTKRSTVPVTQDRCLEMKINVTGGRTRDYSRIVEGAFHSMLTTRVALIIIKNGVIKQVKYKTLPFQQL